MGERRGINGFHGFTDLQRGGRHDIDVNAEQCGQLPAQARQRG
ncbi:hypothetical protein [Amycolatopsis pigmentata]|uniref:Uncharacterized protein n=1 Tax=Amycolatopsis pigmentata TaxID=450801 RepID=A0ABW5G1X7_9PSEU